MEKHPVRVIVFCSLIGAIHALTPSHKGLSLETNRTISGNDTKSYTSLRKHSSPRDEVLGDGFYMDDDGVPYTTWTGGNNTYTLRSPISESNGYCGFVSTITPPNSSVYGIYDSSNGTTLNAANFVDIWTDAIALIAVDYADLANHVKNFVTFYLQESADLLKQVICEPDEEGGAIDREILTHILSEDRNLSAIISKSGDAVNGYQNATSAVGLDVGKDAFPEDLTASELAASVAGVCGTIGAAIFNLLDSGYVPYFWSSVIMLEFISWAKKVNSNYRKAIAAGNFGCVANPSTVARKVDALTYASDLDLGNLISYYDTMQAIAKNC